MRAAHRLLLVAVSFSLGVATVAACSGDSPAGPATLEASDAPSGPDVQALDAPASRDAREASREADALDAGRPCVAPRAGGMAALDTSFGAPVLTFTGIPAYPGLAVAPGGDIYVTAGVYPAQVEVQHIEQSGKIDGAFAGTGILTLPNVGSTWHSSLAVADAQGDLVLILSAAVDGGSQCSLARVHRDGTMDGSFGTQGILPLPSLGTRCTGDAVFPSADGGYTVIAAFGNVAAHVGPNTDVTTYALPGAGGTYSISGAGQSIWIAIGANVDRLDTLGRSQVTFGDAGGSLERSVYGLADDSAFILDSPADRLWRALPDGTRDDSFASDAGAVALGSTRAALCDGTLLLPSPVYGSTGSWAAGAPISVRRLLQSGVIEDRGAVSLPFGDAGGFNALLDAVAVRGADGTIVTSATDSVSHVQVFRLVP